MVTFVWEPELVSAPFSKDSAKIIAQSLESMSTGKDTNTPKSAIPREESKKIVGATAQLTFAGVLK